MNLLMTLVLAVGINPILFGEDHKQTFIVITPPNYLAKVHIKGYVSNSADPELACPRLLQYSDFLSDDDLVLRALHKDCQFTLKIRKIAHVIPLNIFLVSVGHYHDGYERFVDLIGDLRFSVDCVLPQFYSNTCNLVCQQRPRYEPPYKNIINQSQNFDPAKGWLFSSNEMETWGTGFTLKVGPRKRYRINFEYAVAKFGDKETIYEFYYARNGVIYNGNKTSFFLKDNGRWNKFTTVAHMEENFDLSLHFLVRSKDNNNQTFGSMFIRNVEVISIEDALKERSSENRP